ncbi:hypothetical protein ACROYT_G028279 [Oculina patagonica]
MVTPSQEQQEPGASGGAGTNAVEERSGRGSKGKGVCFNCGKEGHFAKDGSCPARGRKCSKRGKYGHYASCCKGEGTRSLESQIPLYDGEEDIRVKKNTFVGQLEAKYPSVFRGIGKLKGYHVKLHVDPSVTTVVQKMRRVPFSMREKVTAKVNELLQKDIIEKVEGPTAWVSSVVVVVPKASGDIRLCVYMRRDNEAIVRERLPIPTIDEVLESLKRSAVFSKLDLRWGFHQIESDADSRDITAFATHDRIFRNKRLSFGVNAAPEKYQHIITQSMAGL